MKRLLHFVRHYQLFSIAIVATVIALLLQLGGEPGYSHLLLAIVAIGEVLPLLWSMWQDLRSGRYGVNILAATAIIGSVILGQYWAAIVVVIMLTGGEALEDFAHYRAQAELRNLLERAPQKAHVIRKGKTLDVTVNELKVGDKIIINPGEIVPVDATVLDGTAKFDESPLTGESLPEPKQAGDELLSGSVNIDSAVTAKAAATAEHSQYQQTIKLVQSATKSHAPLVRQADRYVVPFTVIAYALAIGVWAYSGQAIRFLEIIVVATPGPLLLVAPIALISGMSRASRYGIIIKNGTAFEKLARTRTMAFNKTGTLTRGELVVESVIAYGSFKKDEVVGLAASLAQNSNHPIAWAVTAAAQAKNLRIKKARHVRKAAGLGLEATVSGKKVLVGRAGFLEDNGITAAAKVKHVGKHSVVYVAVDGALAGTISLADELRTDAMTTLHWLDELGVTETLMVTGDNQAAAKAIAKQLDIGHIHAEALPADKLHVLDKVKQRPLAFVGDGVNDAPILTAADVGIALGARGSTAASESADIVIMQSDLIWVGAALSIAKGTFRIAKQSILIGIALSIGLMIIFASGQFTPLAGALVLGVVDAFVIFNALRAHLIKIDEETV